MNFCCCIFNKEDFILGSYFVILLLHINTYFIGQFVAETVLWNLFEEIKLFKFLQECKIFIRGKYCIEYLKKIIIYCGNSRKKCICPI